MRLKTLAGLIVGGLLVASLTGCGSSSNEKINALQQEKIDLAGKVSDLEARTAQAEIEKKTLEGELAAARANANQPIMQDTNGGNGNSDGPRVRQPGPSKGTSEVLHLAGDVAFPSGSVNLTAAAKKELDTLAKKLKGTYAGRNIRVEGHTDSTPIRKSKYGTNEALSQARAEAVRSYLASKGISSSRIEAIGYGSAKPKATPAASRRVDVVVLAD